MSIIVHVQLRPQKGRNDDRGWPHRRHAREFGQAFIHVIPRLGLAVEKHHLRRDFRGIIEAGQIDADEVLDAARLADHHRAAIGTVAAAGREAAVGLVAPEIEFSGNLDSRFGEGCEARVPRAR
jgi:hypothetical protein